MPGEDPEPTEDKKGHLTIKKVTTSEPANGEAYALGEEISYQITVKNDGNLTITDITVKDELTGDEWTIASLAPNETKEFTAKYEVTEKDILNGEVLNVATAEGTSPDPDEPEVPVVPGEDPEPTDDPKPHLTIKKDTTSTPKNGESYALDEKITYMITVTNDGNVTITDITVKDELTGDEWTIASLAPNETKEFTAEHVVVKADILAGKVVNVATAEGDNPTDDPTEIDPGEKEVPTEEMEVRYWFSEGDGQIWYKNSGVDAKFTVSRDPFDEDAFMHFTGIEIDGVEVLTSNYNAVSGSVKLTIFMNFMETLAIGEHSIKANFDDGEASAKFFVAQKEVAPDTGDHSSLGLYVAMFSLSAALSTTMLFTGKRRKREEEA